MTDDQAIINRALAMYGGYCLHRADVVAQKTSVDRHGKPYTAEDVRAAIEEGNRAFELISQVKL